MTPKLTHNVQGIGFVRTVDDASIAFAQSGSGYPLIKAANWMTPIQLDRKSPLWGPWLEALNQRHEVLRYDPRGTGLSDRDANDASLEAFLADFTAVAETVKQPRFAILGIGQGAAVAVQFAAMHPERVSHLILLGGYTRGALQRDKSKTARNLLDAMVKLVEAGWGQKNHAFHQFFATHILPNARPDQLESICEMQRMSATPSHAAKLIRAWSQYDASASLRLVRCPTVVMHCTGDARVPVEEAQFIAKAIPNARFQPLDSSNHIPVPQEDAFDHMLTVIDQFMGEAKSSQAGTPLFMELTKREDQILRLLATGIGNNEIASKLGLSEKTVRNNLTIIYSKIGVKGRSQAIVCAREAHLLG